TSGQIPQNLAPVYVPQLIDNMIQQRAVVYQFQKMGLTATDNEILAGLEAQFGQFFQNGQLVAKDQLAAALSQQDTTLDEVIDNTRQQVLLDKIQNMEYASTVVTPKEIEQAAIRNGEKAKIKYVAFPPAKFRDEAKVAPEEIKTYFDANREKYTTPAKRSYQVVVIDQDKVEQTITVTDAQLQAAYSSSMDSFRTPERVHLRVILLKTADKADAEKKQLLAKAQDLDKQLKAGADFADLAKKNSEDTSAANGGDQGWIARGQMIPDVENVAFALKPKETSGVVTANYGYVIMQVLEHEQPHVTPFSEVRDKLADQIKKESINDKMQSMGDAVQAALAKSPGSVAAVAKQYDAQLITVDKAAAGDAIPGLGVSPEIDNALAAMKKNDVSQVLVLPSNRLAVAVLNDTIPSTPSELSEVTDKIRDTLVNLKSQNLAEQKAKEAADKMKAGESMDKIAKALNLSVTESLEFGHNDSVEGLGTASQVEDAFSKPVGTIIGPVNITGREIVYQVVDHQKADLSKLAADRAQIVDTLRRQKAIQANALFMDSVVTKMTADGTLKINRDAIKQVESSFR
ncbi:MAG: peptidylprolyl isomerase, partial [Bryobacteraceae bacterium]